MSQKIIVPTLGESVTEATVAKWLKAQGEKVNSDEPIVELETDKVNVEVPSPTNGVLETISVILQVASFKLRGKRVFKMAPIHHHFELKGWPEPKVIVRFWIMTAILVLVALATLKVR